MEILNSGYLIDSIPHGNNFIISKSFKKELKRCLFKELRKFFGKSANFSMIYVQFCGDSGWGWGHTKEELLLKPYSIDLNISYSNRFNVSFKPHYGHNVTIFVKNILGGFPILDPTIEVEPNSLEITLEFNEKVFKSLSELFERDFRSKNFLSYEWCTFPVKMQSSGLDCEIKVSFLEVQTKENKSIFISKVIDAVRIHNFANEEGKNSTGLIHNIIKVKSEKTTSDSLTFVVDLGSSGEEGLKVFFKAFEESKFEIESVEVK